MREGLLTAFTLNLWELGVILLALLPVVAIIAYATIRNNRQRTRKQEEDARNRYVELVKRFGLNRPEEEVIASLARHLSDPTRKYLLLQNQRLFHQAASAALDEDEVLEEVVSSLRFKIGFSGPPRGSRPYSSTEIPEGAGILVQIDIRPPEHATVLEPEPSALRLQLNNPRIRYNPGSTIELVYQNSSGIFRFTTTVIAHDETALHAQHSENLTQIQRRKHYRKSMRLPIFVKAAYREEQPSVSQLLDIGGDGASFINPGQRFHQGDDIELTFHPDSESVLHLVASVLRTSQGNTIIHVQFSRIRDRARDQIYNMLFVQDARDQQSDADE